MRLKDITVNIYRCLKEVCMTSGAKVEFFPVRRHRQSSATNNCLTKLCLNSPLLELCSQKSNLLSCVARKPAVIFSFQKFNSLSGVVRKSAIICCQKFNFPSCVATRTATLELLCTTMSSAKYLASAVFLSHQQMRK